MIMNIMKTYSEEIKRILALVNQERDKIQSAALLFADAVEQDRLIYVGHGGAHSAMGLEELFYRAGGLACICPMFDEGVSLIGGAVRATKMERTHGYGRTVVKLYGVKEGDVVLITTSVGITSMAIDEALEVKEVGAKLVVITSTSFAEGTPAEHPARHPSHKNLHDLADVFINCHVPFGDAVLKLPRLKQSFGPTSTAALSFAGNSVIIETIKLLKQRGIDPPIWKSSNTPGGDASNRHLIEKYHPRIRHLA